MKVILLAPGSSRKVLKNRRNFLYELAKKKHNIILCACEHEDTVVDELNAIGISYKEIPFSHSGTNPLNDFATILSIYRLLKIEKPDIIFSYGMKLVAYSSIVASIAKVSNCYSMITGLGYSFGIESIRQRTLGILLRAILFLSLKCNKKVFFQNPDDLSYFVRVGLVASEQSILINGSGVDTRHFEFCPPFTTPITFLIISRLVRSKGILEFIEAAKRIRRSFPKVIFNLVGTFVDNLDAILPEQIYSALNKGIINYLGEVQDVRHSIRAASVFVLPSYYREGIPRTILEAMAMGRPIITTKSPGCRETVEDGNNGFLIPPKDVDALVGAMKAFIAEPHLVNKMGTQSRIIAEKRFEVHKISRLMIEKMGL
jgi:glycosyltransferase involved in cell wall biosynthesis